MIAAAVYFLLFLKASLFSTGGLSNLPSLHQDLIARHWASDSDFGHSVVIGQFKPGPTGLWVISLGYLTHGYLGAALALVAIMIPALLVLVISAGYARIERWHWIQGGCAASRWRSSASCSPSHGRSCGNRAWMGKGC